MKKQKSEDNGHDAVHAAQAALAEARQSWSRTTPAARRWTRRRPA